MTRPRAVVALLLGLAVLGLGVAVPLAAVNAPENRAVNAALEILSADPGYTPAQAAASTDVAVDLARTACDTGTPAAATGAAAFDAAVAAAVVQLCGTP